MNEVDVTAARAVAVAATVERIRAIEAREGVTRAALDAIMAELQALAAQEHLFPFAEFPPPPAGEKGARRYLLQEDAGGRFALYLNALNPGNETKPHDHTTWAVVVAVEGEELNRIYARRAGGLDLVREVVVKPGTGIALSPRTSTRSTPRATGRRGICTCTGWHSRSSTTAWPTIRRPGRRCRTTAASWRRPRTADRSPVVAEVAPDALKAMLREQAELAIVDATFG
jgi:predicted metal-dependent enzyme (double-stranded beta helix superfamily)